jgi:hypothetical protein
MIKLAASVSFRELAFHIDSLEVLSALVAGNV